jgi:hypothetical protein
MSSIMTTRSPLVMVFPTMPKTSSLRCTRCQGGCLEDEDRAAALLVLHLSSLCPFLVAAALVDHRDHPDLAIVLCGLGHGRLPTSCGGREDLLIS